MYIYNLSEMNIHKLTIPGEITQLRIDGDCIDHFDIPYGITSVYIEPIGLKALTLPEGLQCLVCPNNFLRTLDIPQSLTFLDVHNNLLSSLTFKEPSINLVDLDIRSNKFESLSFNNFVVDNLEYFNASINEIKYVSDYIKEFFNKQDIPQIKRSPSPDDLDSDFRYSKSI
jgi:hypothetical protein